MEDLESGIAQGLFSPDDLAFAKRLHHDVDLEWAKSDITGYDRPAAERWRWLYERIESGGQVPTTRQMNEVLREQLFLTDELSTTRLPVLRVKLVSFTKPSVRNVLAELGEGDDSPILSPDDPQELKEAILGKYLFGEYTYKGIQFAIKEELIRRKDENLTAADIDQIRLAKMDHAVDIWGGPLYTPADLYVDREKLKEKLAADLK